jgi:hypothetical protein
MCKTWKKTVANYFGVLKMSTMDILSKINREMSLETLQELRDLVERHAVNL